MKVVRGAGLSYEAASHEDSRNPGVLKKVLVRHPELREGRAQMINWAMLPALSAFRAHYHEDMQEVFIIVHGRAEAVVDEASEILERGDAIIIEAGEVHSLRNLCDAETEYLAFGISGGKGGKTVTV